MQLHFTVEGKGIPIILLHGWGGSSASLLGLQKELVSEGYCVFNLDLPGFGDTPPPQKPFTVENYVIEVKGFIDKLEISKPAVVGHSFGGKVAMSMAIRYPELMSYLVLINASGIKPNNSLKKRIFIGISKILAMPFNLPVLRNFKEFARRIFYKFLVREKDYLNSGNLRETFVNVVNEHFDNELSQIKTKTLLVWGEADKQTPVWMGHKIHRLIEDSRIEVISGATHGLPITSPKLVANLISLFLRSK